MSATAVPIVELRTGRVLIPTTWSVLAEWILTAGGSPPAETLARAVLAASEQPKTLTRGVS